MITAHTPLHLDNGIPEEKRAIFQIDGLPGRLSFYTDRVNIVRAYARSFKDLLMVNDGQITVDWERYAKMDDDERDAFNLVLWAFGILTTNRLGTFSIRPENQIDQHHGPTAYGSERLFFASDRKSDAVVYMTHVIPTIERNALDGVQIAATPLPEKLSVFQCMSLPVFVTITD